MLSGLALREGHAQRGDNELSIEDLVHGPADDAPGEDIQDGNQIQPALTGEDAGGVGHPDLVRALNVEHCRPVRRDRSAVAAVGRSDSIFGSLPRKDSLQAHEPGDAIASSGQPST